MKQCDAVWIVADGVADVHPTVVGDLGPYDLLVETKACGVCAWDAYLFHGQSAPGDFPYVIGHESVGIVREVGPLVKHYKPGDKVFCASGGNAMMAEFFVQDASCCAKLPEDTQDWAKAVLEPVCCVVNLLEKSHIRPGDDVVVVGAGYMGLLTLQGLTRGSWAGEISAFELKPERIALAKKLGVKHVYDPNSEEGKAYIQRIKDKGGAQVVIEFAATDSGYELALQLTRHNAGHLVLGSWHRHGMKFDGTQWHMSGVTVHNLSPMSNANYSEMIPRTAALYTRGVYTPGDYVTHTAHFRDAKDMNALFARAGTKEDGYIKGAILF